MTERKLTDEEVIKALEHAMYSAKGEDGFKELHWEMLKDFLDLINRQKAEIDILIRKHDTLLDEIVELRNENEAFAPLGKLYTEIKAEAIKEFAEIIVSDYPEMEYYLDNLVKK